MKRQEIPKELLEKIDEVFSQTTATVDAALNQLRADLAGLFRFANMDYIDATYLLLEEHGRPLHIEEIVRELKRGGRWGEPSHSRGGADADMKRSISRFAGQSDRICYFGSAENEIIGLVVWNRSDPPQNASQDQMI